jgi:uncharacterized protein (DUF2164 family)
MTPRSPQRIRLSPERRASLLDALQRHFESEFDDPISAFRAEGLVDFFLVHLGPPVYNQGVRDAVGYVQDKLNDIEGEIVEHDPQR